MVAERNGRKSHDEITAEFLRYSMQWWYLFTQAEEAVKHKQTGNKAFQEKRQRGFRISRQELGLSADRIGVHMT